MRQKQQPAVLKQLQMFREDYGTLEAMAEALRSLPMFKNISRATICRWFKKPSGRTKIALRIWGEQWTQRETKGHSPLFLQHLTNMNVLCHDVDMLNRRLRKELRICQRLLKLL